MREGGGAGAGEEEGKGRDGGAATRGEPLCVAVTAGHIHDTPSAAGVAQRPRRPPLAARAGEGRCRIQRQVGVPRRLDQLDRGRRRRRDGRGPARGGPSARCLWEGGGGLRAGRRDEDLGKARPRHDQFDQCHVPAVPVRRGQLGPHRRCFLASPFWGLEGRAARAQSEQPPPGRRVRVSCLPGRSVEAEHGAAAALEHRRGERGSRPPQPRQARR
mmetsp:Transcript_35281/g.79621  ORF Transcript_35281/g.79621 Transcript_35281/m.79621 type:complete len:216 (+) Transcript_35281:43-690(+)